MRDTPYARELATVSYEYPNGSEIRLERLFVYQEKQEEIRLSWWKDGRIQRSPADLPEEHLVELIRRGLAAGVLTSRFTDEMRAMTTER